MEGPRGRGYLALGDTNVAHFSARGLEDYKKYEENLEG